MAIVPDAVQECLRSWFNFPEQEINCQLSTTSKNMPHIRTMHLADITADGQLVLLSHIETQKWYDLSHHSYAAICLHHHDFGQIVAEGEVKLKKNLTMSDPLSKYWLTLPNMFKKIFYTPMENIDETQHEIPPVFGVITVMPSRWEILQVNKENFVDSLREQYLLQDNMWAMEILEPV